MLGVRVGQISRGVILICLAAISSALGQTSVTLEWDPNGEPDLAGYNIYRSNQSGSGYLQLNSSLIQTTFYTDSTLEASRTYYYVCTAVNTGGLESGFSNQVSFSTSSGDPVPNLPPSAANDTTELLEDSVQTIDVLANDSDPDGDQLSITQVSTASHGSVTIVGNALRYTPLADFSGADNFSYTIGDGRGGADAAQVTVTVHPVNDAPLAINDLASTARNSAVVISVLANDSDPEGDPLTVSALTQPQSGTADLQSNGTVSYLPDADFSGNDTFTYTINDGQGGVASASITVLVDVANRAPEASPDLIFTEANHSISIDVLANDTDPEGDPLFVAAVSQGQFGTVTVFDSRQVLYQPSPGYIGTDHFTYQVSDGELQAEATVTVEVLRESDSPGLLFPLSVDRGEASLQDTFVGVALVNPSWEDELVFIRGLDAQGLETTRIQLADPVPARGQVAFLTNELSGIDSQATALHIDTFEEELQGMVMFGDYQLSRLDGIGAEPEAATSLYFPMVRENLEVCTLIYLFNTDQNSGANLTLSLYDEDGNLLLQADPVLEPAGSLVGSLTEIFGGSPSNSELSLHLTSNVPIKGFSLRSSRDSISSLSGRPAGRLTTLRAPHFFVDGEDGPGSVLRLLNSDEQTPARVTVKAFDNGSQLLSQALVEIPAKGLLSRDLRQILELPPTGLTTGFLELRVQGSFGSGAPVVGSITFSAGAQRASTTLPLMSDGSFDSIFPHVAQQRESQIFTGLSILNPGTADSSLIVEAIDETGRKTARRVINLPAGQRLLGLLNEDVLFGEDFDQIKGHLRIRSNVPVLTFAIFGDYSGEFLAAIEGQEARF